MTYKIYLCVIDDMHPYACDGPGKCIHCDRKPLGDHNPSTCPLCDTRPSESK
jgi:hypothetical protein